MEDFLKKAKESSSILSTLSGEKKNKILLDMADALEVQHLWIDSF